MEEPDEIPDHPDETFSAYYRARVPHNLALIVRTVEADLLETGKEETLLGSRGLRTLRDAFASALRRDDVEVLSTLVCIGLEINPEVRNDLTLKKIANALRETEDPELSRMVDKIDLFLPMMRKVENALEARGGGFIDRVAVHREYRPERTVLSMALKKPGT